MMGNPEIPVPLARVRNFEKLGVGMFVHRGLHSQMGKGVWAKEIYHISLEEYPKLFSWELPTGTM